MCNLKYVKETSEVEQLVEGDAAVHWRLFTNGWNDIVMVVSCKSVEDEDRSELPSTLKTEENKRSREIWRLYDIRNKLLENGLGFDLPSWHHNFY